MNGGYLGSKINHIMCTANEVDESVVCTLTVDRDYIILKNTYHNVTNAFLT